MARQALITANAVNLLGSRATTPEGTIRRTVDRLQRILEELPSAMRFEVTRLVGVAPDKVTEAVVQGARKAAKSNDLFLFFYFGHGALSSDLKLQFVHSTVAGEEYLSLETIERKLSSEDPKKTLFIIDCCYAGARDPSATMAPSGEHCRLSSTTPAARAWTQRRRTDHPVGLFTGAILDGLSGHEACRSGTDNAITAESLFRYAEKRTIRDSAGTQTPTTSGYITEAIAEYCPRPDLVAGLATADDKTAYKKLLFICLALAEYRRPVTLDALHRAVLSRHRNAFETLYRKKNGDFSYKPVNVGVTARYVRLLRRLGLIEAEEVALSAAGKALASEWRDAFGLHLIKAIDAYLLRHGLSRNDIEDVLRQVLNSREVPTQENVLDYVVLRNPGVPRHEMGVVLDSLGYMRAVRMAAGRSYFPW